MVRASRVKVAEATDYVLYFCGIECYAKWKTGKPGLGSIHRTLDRGRTEFRDGDWKGRISC